MTSPSTFFSHPLHQAMFVAIISVVIMIGIAVPHSFAAVGPMPITGYVWSSHMGWISFNGTNYGVFEDKANGALSGYAWSSNLGWVTFNASEVSGCPSGGSCAPKVNLTTGAVSGWARACAAFANKNLCSGALDANSGGWDGWVSLSGTASNGSSYGFTQSNTCAWSGYAWGSDAIGWISASGSSYGVTGNDPSACSGAPAASPDLTAGSISPASASTGAATVFSVTISNTGGASTGAGFTNLFQRATNSSGAGATDIGTFVRSTALATGGTMTASLSYTFTSAGTYYMRACADKSSATNTGTITESNETNNCGAWTAVTVTTATAAPVVALSASPTSVTSGSSSTLTWSATNSPTSCTASGDWSGAKAVFGGSESTGAITPPKTYNLSCTGPGGTGNRSVTVYITATTPTASLSVNPTSGQASSTVFTFTAYGSGFKPGGTLMYYFTFGNGGSKWASPLSNNSTTYTYPSAGTYQAKVRISNRMGALGQDQNNIESSPVTIVVTAPASPSPTASLTANPSSINSGGSSTLTWNSTDATSCTAAGGFSTGGAPNNLSPGVSTGALTSTRSYQINCTGPGGSANSNIATVTVSSPQVTISASPARLRTGDKSLISWSASQVDSCTVSGPGLSSSLLTWSQNVTISSQSMFTITCQINGSSATDSVIVNVTPDFQEF